MTGLNPELERKLSLAVERMPAFPRSVQRVLELTRDINCKPKELVAVIEKDPVLTMKILKVINSAHYALAQRVTSINHSVIHLGINTIKNLSLSVAAAGMLPAGNVAGFDTRRYLMHSLATAGVARQLGSAYGDDTTDAGDCYVTGLLHDFGKVVFIQYLSKEFLVALAQSADRQKPLYQAEREIIGVDHGYVGAMLAARWNFSEPLVMCIRNHHVDTAPPSAMLDCLRVADQICRNLPVEGDITFPQDQTPAAPGRFGDSLATVLARCGNLNKIVQDARTFAASENNQ